MSRDKQVFELYQDAAQIIEEAISILEKADDPTDAEEMDEAINNALYKLRSFY